MATALSIWLLGVGPAIVALAIGALATPILVLPPRFSPMLAHGSDVIGWLAFLVTAVAILALGIALRAARARAEDETHRSAFLAEASLRLDAPASVDVRLQRLAQLAVAELADWCTIELVTADGGYKLGAVAHVDPARVPLVEQLRSRFRPDPTASIGVPNVLRTGRSELYVRVDDEMLVAAARSPEELDALRRVGFSSALLAPLAARGRVLGVLTLVNAESGRLLGPADKSLAEELARRAVLSLDLAQLYEDEVRASRGLAGLQRVTAALAEALTYQSVADGLVDEGTPALGADAGVVATLQNGRFQVVASRGYDSALLARWEGMPVDAELPGPEAARSGRIVAVGSRTEMAERFPTMAAAGARRSPHEAILAAPLVVDGESHGFLGFSFTERRAFDGTDAAFVTSMAQLAGVALARAGTYDLEHSIAQTLQRSLLPARLPAPEGLDIGVRYVPLGAGNEVGGDFYDVVEVEGEVLLVIGDVCGKGVEAAALTALARHTVRALAEPGRSPSEILALLNTAVHRQEGPRGRFLTAAICVLRRSGDGWDVCACCAGHPLPLLAARSGRVVPLGAPGTLIGPFPEVQLTEVTGRLERGDALVLYTDGVDEARRDGVLFGEDRLRRLLAARAPDARGVAEAIETEVVRYRGGGELQDDLALVVAVAG